MDTIVFLFVITIPVSLAAVTKGHTATHKLLSFIQNHQYLMTIKVIARHNFNLVETSTTTQKLLDTTTEKSLFKLEIHRQ